jgi:N-acetylglucosaminyldiphosphoundecaprenol N-acetyl-beta-D-mannosaminyltransferase
MSNHADRKRPYITTFLNPYSYLIARKNICTFDQFDAIHFDGKLLCLAYRLIGYKLPRISFDMTSLAPEVLGYANDKNLSVLLIGGLPGIAEKASKKIKANYPKIIISGTHHGFFHNEEEQLIAISNIEKINPDIVICGMGTPFQELFLAKLANTTWKGFGYTCGGFLEQTSRSGLNYYPQIFNKLEIRWLYRIIEDPKLLIRYLKNYPKFIYTFILDASLLKLHKKFIHTAHPKLQTSEK